MAKIWWYREEIVGIIHVFCKQPSVHGFIFSINSTYQNGHNFNLVPASVSSELVSLSSKLQTNTASPYGKSTPRKLWQDKANASPCYVRPHQPEYPLAQTFPLPLAPQSLINKRNRDPISKKYWIVSSQGIENLMKWRNYFTFQINRQVPNGSFVNWSPGKSTLWGVIVVRWTKKEHPRTEE